MDDNQPAVEGDKKIVHVYPLVKVTMYNEIFECKMINQLLDIQFHFNAIKEQQKEGLMLFCRLHV